ncbi:MAG: Flp pilus assembly complex ATPase component TadA [Desulfarculaceae bacterium]|nr:Flp pilus assembly complex ATPase component TadA [Desulfarculaceae bacterium]
MEKTAKQGIKDAGEIASLLAEDGIVTEDQVRYAMRVKEKLATEKNLIETLKELKYINDGQIKQTLRTHHLSLRIGDLLVELGYLSKDRLNAAIELQKQDKGKRLGEIILENRFISESAFLEILSVQMGFPYVDLAFAEIDTGLTGKAPVKWCESHRFVPVRVENNRPVIAFADPLNESDIKGAKELFGENFTVAISSPTSIQLTLEKIKSGKIKNRDVVDESTVRGIVDTVIGKAIEEGASDIHIEPLRDRIQIRFRIDGILVHHKDYAQNILPMLASRLKILSGSNIAEKRRHQGGRISYEYKGNTFDMRLSFYITVFGEKIVMRILNRIDQIISIENIGLQPKMMNRFLMDVLNVPSGVLIITGPTGSGKTTTLYSCVNHINSPQTSILTAEDPVEYVMDGVSQCSINPDIGLTYEETLRHVVRQDPDVIVIGEIRDNYSADVAVHAALTGHKVLTSFHTEDSISGLIRLLNMDIEAFLISSTVVCVMAQRLLRRICPFCVQPYTPTPYDLKLLGYAPGHVRRYRFLKGQGCRHCRHTGYKGRLAVFEMLVLNEDVRDAVLNHKSSYEIRKISIETSGLVTLMEDAISKATAGLTTMEEIFRCVPRLIPPRPINEIHRLQGL